MALEGSKWNTPAGKGAAFLKRIIFFRQGSTCFLIFLIKNNHKEIKIKEKQGVSAIFLSSIFKHNKNYLGINKFKLLSSLTKRKIIALGGISKNNQKKLRA